MAEPNEADGRFRFVLYADPNFPRDAWLIQRCEQSRLPIEIIKRPDLPMQFVLRDPLDSGENIHFGQSLRNPDTEPQLRERFPALFADPLGVSEFLARAS